MAYFPLHYHCFPAGGITQMFALTLSTSDWEGQQLGSRGTNGKNTRTTSWWLSAPPLPKVMMPPYPPPPFPFCTAVESTCKSIDLCIYIVINIQPYVFVTNILSNISLELIFVCVVFKSIPVVTDYVVGR